MYRLIFRLLPLSAAGLVRHYVISRVRARARFSLPSLFPASSAIRSGKKPITKCAIEYRPCYPPSFFAYVFPLAPTIRYARARDVSASVCPCTKMSFRNGICPPTVPFFLSLSLSRPLGRFVSCVFRSVVFNRQLRAPERGNSNRIRTIRRICPVVDRKSLITATRPSLENERLEISRGWVASERNRQHRSARKEETRDDLKYFK